jgi:hypothetical protein
MRTAVILQSNYIPWRGYFDLLRQADVFVLYDEVQFTERDWRNRNRIMTRDGPRWLTIPVLKSGKFGQTIAQTEVADASWARKHWARIQESYAKSPNFQVVSEWLEPCLVAAGAETRLSQINHLILTRIAAYLDLSAEVLWSEDIPGSGDRIQRLVQICSQLGADRLLCGPAAQSYLDTSAFQAKDIEVDWMQYPTYPVTASSPEGEPLSVLDALFWLPKDKIFAA